MLKKRIIFTLLYNEGHFCLSRNFNLQKVGDVKWLIENYDFYNILENIDELMILNISKAKKGERYSEKFFNDFDNLFSKAFVPISMGGGIKNFATAKKLFEKGADKVILNTAFFNNEELIKKLVNTYGSQSIISSIDYRISETGNLTIYTDNGNEKIDLSISDCINYVQDLGAGELFLNSIDRDGLGYGYDFKIVDEISNICKIPLVKAGGADNHLELLKGINHKFIDACSTSHLFNFMGNGLVETRLNMIELKANIPLR